MYITFCCFISTLQRYLFSLYSNEVNIVFVLFFLIVGFGASLLPPWQRSMFLVALVCLSVCLWTTLLKKL